MTSQVREFGLNIHMIEIHLIPKLMRGNDFLIHVSTRPEHYIDEYIVPYEKVKDINHVFSINVRLPIDQTEKISPNQTQTILISFIMKDKLKKDRKVAIGMIHPEDLPKISLENDENGIMNAMFSNVNVFQIYKTSKDQKKEYYKDLEKGIIGNYQVSDHNTIKRKSVGEMKIQLSLCQTFDGIKQNIPCNDLCKEHKEKETKFENTYRYDESNETIKSRISLKCKNNNSYEKIN